MILLLASELCSRFSAETKFQEAHLTTTTTTTITTTTRTRRRRRTRRTRTRTRKRRTRRKRQLGFGAVRCVLSQRSLLTLQRFIKYQGGNPNQRFTEDIWSEYLSSQSGKQELLRNAFLKNWLATKSKNKIFAANTFLIPNPLLVHCLISTLSLSTSIRTAWGPNRSWSRSWMPSMRSTCSRASAATMSKWYL